MLSSWNTSLWSSPNMTTTSGRAAYSASSVAATAVWLAVWRSRIRLTSSCPANESPARAKRASKLTTAPEVSRSLWWRSWAPRSTQASGSMLIIGLCEQPIPSTTCAMRTSFLSFPLCVGRSEFAKIAQDRFTFDPYAVTLDRERTRQLARLAGCNVESSAVQRTVHDMALDLTLRQRSETVSAGVLGKLQSAFDVKERERLGAGLAQFDLLD